MTDSIQEHYDKLAKARRVVVKVGSSLLASEKAAGVDKSFIRRLSKEIAVLKKQGKEVVLVSSGSVACGKASLDEEGLKPVHRSRKAAEVLSARQALSAMGQPLLMEHYRKSFRKHGYRTAQVLVTESNVQSKEEYQNLRGTFDKLLEWSNVIPVVNENDSVATEELCFGDNDVLSSVIAGLISADLLILLTTVDGLLKDGRVVEYIPEVKPEHMEIALGPSGPGRGGMRTKLKAARTITRLGGYCIISSGLGSRPITDLLTAKKRGTLCSPTGATTRASKRWMLFSRRVSGRIYVDDGARKALTGGDKSLLAAGITKVKGKFDAGELVHIYAGEDHIATGVSTYPSGDVQTMLGKKTSQLDQEMGAHFKQAVIHKDNMVVD